MKKSLNSLALRIYQCATAHNISLKVLWIPRSLNHSADALSRVTDYDDWSVSDKYFSQCNTLWGPYTIDRFANYFNTKLERFNSRFWNPGTEVVDAFSVPWYNEQNWLVPPPQLVLRTLKHLSLCRASGTLVVPEWPTAPFWPILFPYGRPSPFIKDFFRAPTVEAVRPGTLPTSTFNNPGHNSHILFLHIQGLSENNTFIY